jgi:hypothetical protein
MRIRDAGRLCLVLLAACGRSGLLQSDITVSPASIAFGEVELQATAQKTVTVANQGLTPDQVVLKCSGDSFTCADMRFSLGTHASIEVPVFFTPTALGSATALLHLEWAGGAQVQDVALSGIGTPFPCEANTPDGTPCQLWWAPCAVGAVCRSGVCRSASAEAEQPGDLRWTYPVDLAQPLVAGPQGEIFSLLFPHRGVLALDACGKQLWQSQDGYDYLLLGGEVLVAATQGGLVAGLSRLDGSLLWSANVAVILGCTAPGAPCANPRINQPMLTNQGALYVIATTTNTSGGETVTRLTFPLDGGLVSSAALAPEPKGFALGSVVGDAQGNTYFASYIDGTLADLYSYDLSGELRFRVKELQDPGDLAVGQAILVGTGTSWSLDGNTSAQIPSPTGLGSSGCGNAGAIGFDGTLYCFTSANTHDTLMAVPQGADVWSWTSPLPTGFAARSNMVLGDPGLLFLYARQPGTVSSENLLLALSTGDGGVSWTAQPFQTPMGMEGLGTPPSLTLTPSATLVSSDRGAIYGVFAGQVRPAAGAFWSRFGGDETNRSVPAATAGSP